MYKAATRWMTKRNIDRLNRGDYGPSLAMYADDATLTFPGDNSWATMFRPYARSRDAIPTHRGKAEIEAFLRRYTELGLQMVADDILVNGPPWRARAAVRCRDFLPSDSGDDYNNRAVPWVRSLWGRIVEHEDYEDTERAADFDAVLGTSAPR